MVPATYRGQPLVALMLLLGGWVAIRAMVWDASAEPSHARPGLLAEEEPATRSASSFVRRHPGSGHAASAGAPAARDSAVMLDPAPLRPPFGVPLAGAPVTAAGTAAAPAQLPVMPRAALPVLSPARDPVAVAVGHNLLWMAAVSRMPLLMAGTATEGGAVQPPPGALLVDPVPQSTTIRRVSRWSADAWLMLREGGKSNFTGVTGPPSYGASQAGAVLRYRLAPASPHRPTAYMLAATALNGVRDREVAAGLSVRPIRGLPVIVAGELRARDEPDRVRVRPALVAITELPWVALPLGTRLEAYGQAGYVAGRGHTAFVDGLLKVDRKLTGLGRAELRAGAGVWGGAQKGAARLDIGPSASVGIPIRDSASARIAVDWRFRVSGNAAPASGPALTLSAGF